MNFINIAGHLGADPEVRYTSNGKKVTELRVAARARKGANDDTIWWRVSVWGEQWDKMISFLKKGSPVIVYGEIQKPEIFNDREGKPQISMNMTASHLSFSPFGKPDRENGNHSSPQGTPNSFQAPQMAAPVNPYMKNPMASTAPQGEVFDDEVPF